MSKKVSMMSALSQAAGKPAAGKAPVQPEPANTTTAEVVQLAPAAKVARAPSREGKKNMSVWVSQDAHLEFSIAAKRHGVSTEAAMKEAMNLWFELKGLPPIA